MTDRPTPQPALPGPSARQLDQRPERALPLAATATTSSTSTTPTPRCTRTSTGATPPAPTSPTGSTTRSRSPRRPAARTRRAAGPGCVVDDDGVPTAVYTGSRPRPRRASARSAWRGRWSRTTRRLTEWKPLPTPVVDRPAAGLDVVMFRDPFVFRSGGRRWALVGAGPRRRHAVGPAVRLRRPDRLAVRRCAAGRQRPGGGRRVRRQGDRLGVPAAVRDRGRATGCWWCRCGTATRCSTGYLTGRLEADGDGGLRFVAAHRRPARPRPGLLRPRRPPGARTGAPAVGLVLGGPPAQRRWTARAGPVSSPRHGSWTSIRTARCGSYRPRSSNCCARPSRSSPHRAAPRSPLVRPDGHRRAPTTVSLLRAASGRS